MTCANKHDAVDFNNDKTDSLVNQAFIVKLVYDSNARGMDGLQQATEVKLKHPAPTRIISSELERLMAGECRSHNSRRERWKVGSYELQAMQASLFVKLHTCANITTQFMNVSV
jgi:hypothetical protein